MTTREAYAWVENDARLDAYCVTAVTGVPLDEVVRRFGGDPKTASRATFEDAFNGAPHPTWILVDEIGPGVLVAENNGWWGVQEDVGRRVSAGGRLASFYVNVNAVMAFLCAIDGDVVAWFDPLLEDVPESLAVEAAGLDFGDRVEGSCFALLERLTGVPVGERWLLEELHLRVAVPSPY